LTPKPVKIRSDIELTCYTYEGINAIKAALRAGEAVSTEAVPIKIRLVAPPLYVMSTTSTDKTSAIDLMGQAIVKIQEKMAEFDGNMNVAMAVSRWRRLRRIPLRTLRLFLVLSAQGRVRD
jgi:translation initiation factor 2 subunit 1